MKVKDLREILEQLGPDCDDFPVLVQTNYAETPKVIGLNENEWELDGHSIETSALLFFKGKLPQNKH